ncbi:CGNR zinc finger domain-containing protein [Nocardia sp. NBC_01327]|uniref:CGNR zinc finger domain-containing protein n=1 Tax=Nocardia sp. NBC_01327 TaxID=2903593 RepID=UPI002E0EC4A5|nr:CGNR zinc finger domain-containing protein [Nocardia sp. NBC_01327]
MTDESNPRGLYFLAELANAVEAQDADRSELERILRYHGAPDPHLSEVDAVVIRSATGRIGDILATRNPDEAAFAINTLLTRYPARPVLVQLPGRPWSMHSHPPETADREYWLLSTAALALGLWLSDTGRCAWGRCAAPDCHRFYIDTGRRQPQKYCTPRCATRTRVATHRQRTS